MPTSRIATTPRCICQFAHLRIARWLRKARSLLLRPYSSFRDAPPFFDGASFIRSVGRCAKPHIDHAPDRGSACPGPRSARSRAPAPAPARFGQQDALIAVQHHVPPPLTIRTSRATGIPTAWRRQIIASASGTCHRPPARNQRQIGPYRARRQCVHMLPGVDQRQPAHVPPQRRHGGSRRLCHQHRPAECGAGPGHGGQIVDAGACRPGPDQRADGKIEGKFRGYLRRRLAGTVDRQQVDHELGAFRSMARHRPRTRMLFLRWVREIAMPSPNVRQTATQPQSERKAVSASAAATVGPARRGRISLVAVFHCCMRHPRPSSGTSSGKLMPTACACSGLSDVAVMPGWVLVSKQDQPVQPRASSQRKSVRLTPRQPKALVRRRA